MKFQALESILNFNDFSMDFSSTNFSIGSKNFSIARCLGVLRRKIHRKISSMDLEPLKLQKTIPTKILNYKRQ